MSPVTPSSSRQRPRLARCGSRARPAPGPPAGRTRRGAPASSRPRPGSSGGFASSPCSRGLYYNGRAKSMGKRELLLISGFAVIGLLVYQLTMPATADTGGGFAAWWARVRSHVGAEPRRAALRTQGRGHGAGRHPHGGRAAGPRLGDDPRRAARHHRGRPLGRRLRRRRADGQRAGAADHGRRHHGRADHEARHDPAEAGRAAPAGRASSSRCACRRGSASSCAWAAASSTSPTWAPCRSSRRRAASGSPRSPAPSPASWARARSRSTTPGRWPSRPATARSASPTSPARSRSRRGGGDFRARGIGGPAHLEGRDVEAELEDLAGPLRLTGSGGEVRVRDVRGADHGGDGAHHAQADARHRGRDLGDDRARRDRADAAVGRDRCSTRKATDGDIRTPDGLITVQRSGDDATASGPLRGGGPRVMLRTSRGDITVR